MTHQDEERGIVVQVGAATVQMGPVGFALYGEEFFLAAMAIPEQSQARGNTTFTPVPYYLLCRALELMLKAFLLTKGHSVEGLKKRFGHDLETLWESAKDKGILDVLPDLGSEFETDLRNANSYYKGKAFEYFDFRRWAHGYEGLPDLDRYRDGAKIVIAQTKAYCFSVS